MTQRPTSGKPDITSVVRQRKHLILPIDDPRNNDRYRKAHPDVIFKGYSKPKILGYSDLNPAERNRPGIRTSNNTTTQAAHSSHAPAGNPSLAQSDYVNDLLDSEIPEASGSGESDEPFFYYEVSSEDYVPEDYGYQPVRNSRSSEGVSTDEDGGELIPPTNLYVYDIAVIPEVDSSDGIPTYMATLTFDAENSADDYEIRIVKAQ